MSLDISPPSSAISNPSLATTSGTKNFSTTMTWDLNHLLSAGYGNSPIIDILYYSGPDITSSHITTPGQYSSISQSTSEVIDSSTSVTYSFGELINYNPIPVSYGVSQKTVNPDQPITYYVNSSEQITGEPDYKSINFGDGGTSTSSPSTSYSTSFTHDYSSVGSYTPYFTITNVPNAPSSSLSTSSQNLPTISVLPFALTPSPPDYSSVGTSVPLTLSYNSQSSADISEINLTVNSVLEDRFQPGDPSGRVTYDFSQPVAAPLLVVWTVTDQYGYSQSISFQYGSNLTPAEYSNKVTVLQSANATYSYPISLSGVPAGTGF